MGTCVCLWRGGKGVCPYSECLLVCAVGLGKKAVGLLVSLELMIVLCV